MEKYDNCIVKIKYGSHLYGTNTEKSDTDYKGVYMPSLEDILLGKIVKSRTFNSKESWEGKKNSSTDFDEELYSLQYFIDLACAGETVALDMLFSPLPFLEFFSKKGKSIWLELVLNRHLLITKNLNAFIGYCRKQASKYGIKGSRLSNAEDVVNCFKWTILHHGGDLKLKQMWELLPSGEHILKTVDNKGIRIYEVCGRKIQETASIEYAYNIVSHFYSEYGQRAKLAKENKNIDWKAISHALRVAYEMKEIYLEGNITFPLKEAQFLKEVKKGELDYISIVAPKLEKLVDEVEKLSQESLYPEMIDKEYWNDLLISLIKYYYNI